MTRNDLSRVRRVYIVAVLCAVIAVNAADRYSLSVLIQPIKGEFRLTDGESGALLGLAFAIAYCAFAIPLGRWVDRGHRVRLVAGCLTVWSICTAAFGTTRSFWQLVTARVGVAAGEAGAFSAVQSLIGDYFPPHRRGAVICCMQLGSLAGMMAGLSLGGWLSVRVGWRAAFFVLGLAGLPLVPLIIFGMREPARGAADDLQSIARPKLGTLTALRELWSRRAYRLTLAGAALSSLAMIGAVAWLPSLLMRRFLLTDAQGGLLSGALIPAPMMLGTLVGGLCSDLLYRTDKRWSAWLPALCYLAAAPCLLAVVSVPSVGACFTAMALFAFFGGVTQTPIMSLTLSLSGAAIRGTSASIVALLVILVGNGLAPALIGSVSDLIHDLTRATQPLGTAIAITVVPLLAAALPLVFAARHIEADLSRARVVDMGYATDMPLDPSTRLDTAA